MKKLLTLAFLVVASSFGMNAQEALQPKPSPMYMTRANVGDAQLAIVYSRPHKKDREIFGNLVPYGEVWRLGANEAVLITLTADINFAGTIVPAGSYNLYAIPGEDEWTLIFSSRINEWGAYRYSEANDVARIAVPVTSSPTSYEAFTISAESETEDQVITIMWDTTAVVIPISEG